MYIKKMITGKLKIIEKIYSHHRRCVVRDFGGKIFEIKDAARMTLGFEKAVQILNQAEISSSDVVLNIFGGAGGIIRLLSLCKPKKIIGIDLLYPGKKNSHLNWQYLTDDVFNCWVEDLIENEIFCFKEICWPIFYQADATKVITGLVNKVDLIIIDPPFGWVAKKILNLNEDDSMKIFYISANISVSYLKPGGQLLALIPYGWLNINNPNNIYFKNSSQIISVGRNKKLALINYKEGDI